jgi:voltage-gated potassium channel
MKFLPVLYSQLISNPGSRRNLVLLGRFLVAMLVLVVVYSVVFHVLMGLEGQQHSWFTGVYWSLTVMSTLGTGDITFTSDAGRLFSMVVLLSGATFMLVMLPFLFIQFFYLPWMQAQHAARAPRLVPETMSGHVVLTNYDAVTRSLINKLISYNYTYVLIVPKLEKALHYHDLDICIVLGELDDPDVYRSARIEHAAMVATTCTDEINTHVVFTVRALNADIPIVATANDAASVDILELAGCTRVFQLGNMMGEALARRTSGNDAMTHEIGAFDELLVAEASAHATPLAGKTVSESKLRENVSLSLVGMWERGKFILPEPDAVIDDKAVLVLVGTRSQMEDYDELFCIYNASDAPVVIIGGGRVGRATSAALTRSGIRNRIIEKLSERVRDPELYVQGSAAELSVLEEAGIMEASAVIITPHDDDTNVYLTLYCRRLRPDIQIITRAVLERNVATMHRAGSDFVMSYASMGANAMFNTLKGAEIVMLAEGLDFFRVSVPPSLVGKSIIETAIRQKTGSTVVAVRSSEGLIVNPDPSTTLPADAELILIGRVEAEELFLKVFGG